jgi:hypothetical protein
MDLLRWDGATPLVIGLLAGGAALLAAFLGHNPMEALLSMLPAKGVQLIIASDPAG